MVGQYKARFGDKYNFKGAAYKEPSPSAPAEEWKILLDSMKAEIASKNAVPQFKSSWEWITRGVFMLWAANPQYFPDPTDENKPMNLHGMPQVLGSQRFYDNVDDEINQIVIEYERWFSTGPIRRFGQAALMAIMEVNQHNKTMEKRSRAETESARESYDPRTSTSPPPTGMEELD